MITDEEIVAMISLYQKHGWNLRRVLLSEKLKSKISLAIFVEAEIEDSEINAAWFSRASGNDGESWELRLLSQNPYALVETFDAEDEEEVREEARKEIEDRIRKQLMRGN
jgi:hypothetical protein